MAKSVKVLMEKSSIHKPAKVPMREMGTAIIGINVARQLCKNTKTTRITRIIASPNVLITSQIEAFTKSLVS